MLRQLLTEKGEHLGNNVWTEYPRPQLVREKWLSLNGIWEFCEQGSPQKSIRVPFCPESLLSGINRHPRSGAELQYCRHFVLPENWAGRRVLLHFGAVDQIAEVFVNGTFCGRHEGGYLAFTLDITEQIIPGENFLQVNVRDPLDRTYPWGKQSEQRGGMWYTPVSGIWQTVWLEPVPEHYVESLKLDCSSDRVTLTVQGLSEGTVIFEDKNFPLVDGTAELIPKKPRLWSPEDPFLYEFTLRAGEDEVRSYFALRTLTVETQKGIPRLCLNGKPYYFHGLLDQGYWSDGLYTPADGTCFAEDILAMKALGFNTLRKHIKIEPERFYYDCDRLGMVVFQDMVNNAEYSFLRDTVLPTVGFQRLKVGRKIGKKAREEFLRAMKETVHQLGNHPCICLWTVFNEGWGQFEADSVYDRLRELDTTRFIDTTSGWFRREKSTVESRHVYFHRFRPSRRLSRPLLLSEFGGYACKLPEYSANLEKTYGYKKCRDTDTLEKDLRALYEQQIIPAVKNGLCGSIYTQVSDVEDETNGLMTYDRRVQKLHPENFADIGRRLKEQMEYD